MKNLLYASLLSIISIPAFSASAGDLVVPLFLDGVFLDQGMETEIDLNVEETGLSINCVDQRPSTEYLFGFLGSITTSSHVRKFKDYYERALSVGFDQEQQFLIGHYTFITNNDKSHSRCDHGIRIDFQYTDPKTRGVVTAYTDVEFSGNIIPTTDYKQLKELENKVVTIKCKSNFFDDGKPQYCLSEIQ